MRGMKYLRIIFSTPLKSQLDRKNVIFDNIIKDHPDLRKKFIAYLPFS